MEMEQTDPGLAMLLLLEPFPVEPPDYESTLPRVNRPTYTDFKPYNEKLPSYSPTVYKLGVLYRKMEWTSPFEMAQQRTWKPYIFELNNTQLNIYRYPAEADDSILTKFDPPSSFSSNNSYSLLHPYHYHHLMLKKLQHQVAPTALASNDDDVIYSYNEDNFRSIMTTKTDLKALKYFKSINALESTNIVRSYSLQYGKIGLSIDYKKKPHVFRCRFESEQFLIDFPNAEGMVEWYNAINLGIDNSLDLNRREMPTHRTVPRRRRRKVQQMNHPHFSSARNIALGLGFATPGMLSDSNSSSGKSSTSSSGKSKKELKGLFKGKSIDSIFKLGKWQKFDSKSRPASSNSNNNQLITSHRNMNKIGSDHSHESSPSAHVNTGSFKAFPSSGRSNASGSPGRYNREGLPIDDDGFEIVEEYDDEFIDDDEDEFVVDDGTNGRSNTQDDLDSSIEDTDQEDNEELIDENFDGNIGFLINKFQEGKPSLSALDTPSFSLNSISSCTASGITSMNTGSSKQLCKLRTYREYIAKPSPLSVRAQTYPAQRKIIRDSIRCMVPLTENERWIGKFLLLDYDWKYKPQSKEDVDHHFQSIEVLTHVSDVGSKYKHKFRRPLQEWIVTPSGLLPYINPSAFH